MTHLVCPNCNLTQKRSFVGLRLETCPRCDRKGSPVYLVSAPGPTTGGTSAKTHPASRRAA
jgi:hypothetical protein